VQPCRSALHFVVLRISLPVCLLTPLLPDLPQKISLTVREEKCTRRPGRCSYTLVQVLKGNKVCGTPCQSATDTVYVLLCTMWTVDTMRHSLPPCCLLVRANSAHSTAASTGSGGSSVNCPTAPMVLYQAVQRCHKAVPCTGHLGQVLRLRAQAEDLHGAHFSGLLCCWTVDMLHCTGAAV
jgi:hypothetical protein